MKARIRGVRRAAAGAGLGGFLATQPVSLRYLSGLADLIWLLVTRRGVFVMPQGLAEYAARTSAGRGMKVLKYRPGWEPLVELLAAERVTRLGMEGGMGAALLADIRGALRSTCLTVPMQHVVEMLRKRKSPVEISALERAALVAREVAAMIPGLLTPGVRERDVAVEIDCALRRLGAEAPAFDTIVLAGARSALPHGKPSDARLREGDLCLADFGARIDGYHSDVTRVFVVGRPSPRQERIYRAVWRSYVRGRALLGPGRRAGAVFRAAHGALGPLSRRFIHGLGHGVGLEIHEGPGLYSGSRERLAAGHVVTVEPGVYIPRWGGIRLEDTFLITPRGWRSLTGEPPRTLRAADE